MSPTTRRYIARVLSGGDFLLGTINDILDFSKLEAGQLELMAEPVAPAGLVRETLDLFSLEAAAKNLDLQVEGDEVCEIDPLTLSGEYAEEIRELLEDLEGLAGLHAAHEASDERGSSLGIIHRDVSPQNIMVGTVQGAIFYLRNGRVPIRAKGANAITPIVSGGRMLVSVRRLRPSALPSSRPLTVGRPAAAGWRSSCRSRQ